MRAIPMSSIAVPTLNVVWIKLGSRDIILKEYLGILYYVWRQQIDSVLCFLACKEQNSSPRPGRCLRGTRGSGGTWQGGFPRELQVRRTDGTCRVSWLLWMGNGKWDEPIMELNYSSSILRSKTVITSRLISWLYSQILQRGRKKKKKEIYD